VAVGRAASRKDCSKQGLTIGERFLSGELPDKLVDVHPHEAPLLSSRRVFFRSANQGQKKLLKARTKCGQEKMKKKKRHQRAKRAHCANSTTSDSTSIELDWLKVCL